MFIVQCHLFGKLNQPKYLSVINLAVWSTYMKVNEICILCSASVFIELKSTVYLPDPFPLWRGSGFETRPWQTQLISKLFEEAALSYVKFGSYLFHVFNRKLSIYSQWQITNTPPYGLQRWALHILVLNMQGFTLKFMLYFATHNTRFTTPVYWCTALLVYSAKGSDFGTLCVKW